MFKNINIAFIRHGFGCHNAAKFFPGSKNYNVRGNQLLNDPELTNVGRDASRTNGLLIYNIFKKLKKIIGNKDYDMTTINFVGCSPLIRSMETAYYMTLNWKTPPEKIYVFPFLREIDEYSNNKYSPESRQTINEVPSYAMKSIVEQKQYLESRGILDKFDFTFVENLWRYEPGDITTFTKWLSVYFLSNRKELLKKYEPINLMIITHAGVLKDYTQKGYYNNSGFILNSILNTNTFDVAPRTIIALDDMINKDLFVDYTKIEKYDCYRWQI